MPRRAAYDIELVRLAARTKIVTPEVVVTRFGMSQANAYRRLAVLTRDGFLGYVDRAAFGRIHFATRAGIALAGLDLPPPRFALATLEHDLAIAQTCALLEATGIDCLTERELRSHQRTTGDDRYVFEAALPGQWKTSRFFPDLVIESPTGQGFLAIEIELSQKAAVRRRMILSGYCLRRYRDDFVGVLYLVGPRSKSALIPELANEVGLGDGFAMSVFGCEPPLRPLQKLIDAYLARTA